MFVNSEKVETYGKDIMEELTHAKPLKTSLIDCAVFIRWARRHTDTIRALHWLRAVRWAVTCWWDPNTFNFRISCEVLRTNTLLSVTLNAAECIYSARSLNSARIFALSFIAHFIGLAVSIICTSSWNIIVFYVLDKVRVLFKSVLTSFTLKLKQYWNFLCSC